ncbi:serine/threonine-protein kinase [Streptomyces pseudovenezuelae]|uniref:non-specific serine/threonine protein kinase n=1 Tax=Streptomyces pseudovenezuelae TaxID=67350 RepID=A0ABT6LFE4_9ACTN|nr:serine/threonine protein kinase [Streptomyces pseudovenezuelae]MDH6215034.1 serine/threonine protein kinase [Streptomyces pseudovenezuelae]
MGEVFAGRYELVDPIGRGGVGAVWRAWDHRRRRYVAAKVLQQRDAHSLLRFVREQALRIDHPHVLAPASWAADDDKVLFTMDLVAGGSLVHLVGDYGPLPPAFVCTLIDQLLSGLAAVHAEGVVHRDIKPANVLLEATGTARPRLRLSDFGIAMRLGEPRLTETNLVVGTPGYLAPEQMMGSEPDFPADLFAVGLVALYLLEGAKPDAKALVQYFAEYGTPSAPKSVPEPLWQVVATLLQPDPVARFRTATGARKALAAASELLPEPGPDDELIEIFDQIGPLPTGFVPEGPLKAAAGVDTGTGTGTGTGVGSGRGPRTGTGVAADSAGGGGRQAPYRPGDSTTSRSRMASHPLDPRQSTGSQPPSDTSSPSDSAPPTPPSSQPPSMSDTGSFHLPPPQATGSSPHIAASGPATPTPQAHPHQGAQHQPHQPNQPAHVSPHDPTHVLSSPQPPAPWHEHPGRPPAPASEPESARLQRAEPSTASYTAQVPQVPPPAQKTSRRSHRATRAARRAGPPAKVAIPLLLLALTCYAVGFWALTQI